MRLWGHVRCYKRKGGGLAIWGSVDTQYSGVRQNEQCPGNEWEKRGLLHRMIRSARVNRRLSEWKRTVLALQITALDQNGCKSFQGFGRASAAVFYNKVLCFGVVSL